MSRQRLTCSDGHKLDAIWQSASVDSSPRGLVLLHEIFGLTEYLEDLCVFWSSKGFNVLAPALFDRFEPERVIDYASPQEGLEIVAALDLSGIVKDIEASIAFLRRQGAPVGVLGYCWGGGLAYHAACELDVDAAACVYPTRLLQYTNQSPKCPVQFQLAERDKHASPEVRAAVNRAAPNAATLLFPADHAFDRNADSTAMPASRDALTRFFLEHL